MNKKQLKASRLQELTHSKAALEDDNLEKDMVIEGVTTVMSEFCLLIEVYKISIYFLFW
jgi:hypothetical protein